MHLINLYLTLEADVNIKHFDISAAGLLLLSFQRTFCLSNSIVEFESKLIKIIMYFGKRNNWIKFLKVDLLLGNFVRTSLDTKKSYKSCNFFWRSWLKSFWTKFFSLKTNASYASSTPGTLFLVFTLIPYSIIKVINLMFRNIFCKAVLPLLLTKLKGEGHWHT